MKKPKDPIEEYLNNLNCFLIVLFIWVLFMFFIFVAIFFDIKDNIKMERYSQEQLFLKPEIRQHEIDNVVISNNFLLPISSVVYAKEEIDAIITGYSSTPDQTDSTPFITASGQKVREGIVANNCLPFGTIIETENGELLEVQDRMNKRYPCHYFDKWYSTKQEALEHGVRKEKIINY